MRINRKQLEQILVKKKCIFCDGNLILDIEYNSVDIKITFHFTCKKCGFNDSIESPIRSKEILEDAFSKLVDYNIKEKGFVRLQGVL
ncbi:MAG: hypothetical protein ACFFDF_03955 [Candidatus Odinarchaeota archaeon]